jgi:polysaccharide biosynthesis transport protein
MDNAVARARAHLHEAVREIQVMAGFARDDESRPADRPVVIGITSPDYGDGKTTVAIALAASLSTDLGANVTLVDADLHTHSIGREFGLESLGGLTDVLAGTVKLADAKHAVLIPNLTVIGVGTAGLDAARVAYSSELRDVITTIRRESRFVVVDLPATLHSMTASVLAQRCDGVIVVARAGHTTSKDIERVVRLLRDANLLGVVINRANSHIPGFVARALNLQS